jgi:DNA polymerase (family 10)
MPRTNEQVGALLQEMAELLAIGGADPFRVRAYEKAARAVDAYPKDVADLDLKGLQAIPSVGKNMASRILEYTQGGRIMDLEELRERIPAGLRELTRIPGVGPRKAVLLNAELGIRTVDELLQAVEAHRLRGVRGLGPKTEENILAGIAQVRRHGERVQLDVAMEAAEEIVAALRGLDEVAEIGYAGSLRRMRDTIGDLDILAASHEPAAVMDAFTRLPVAERVLAHGDTKAAVLTTRGLQVDLRVVEPDAWGAAMIYFTGSKAHNIRIREMAVRKGLKLSEYGLFRTKDNRRIAARSEEEVYAKLGLPLIPAPMREDSGEVEAALAGELPAPVEVRDIRGDLHTHTDRTDGHATLDEMLAAAAKLGHRYYAVTDHAEKLAMTGMSRDSVIQQRKEIARVQRSHPKIMILQGCELNIDPKGGVDYDPEFLCTFDILIASVHSHFNLGRAAMTKRLIAAMENPNVHVIGHPSARLIGRRPPIDFDLEAVLEASARTGTAMELNAFPDRLDLRDDHLRRAREHGVTIAIDTDSHAVGHLDNLRYGVGTAQRGWITAKDVLNTRTLGEVRTFVARKRARG